MTEIIRIGLEKHYKAHPQCQPALKLCNSSVELPSMVYHVATLDDLKSKVPRHPS